MLESRLKKGIFSVILFLIVLGCLEIVAQFLSGYYPNWFEIVRAPIRGEINKTMLEHEELIWHMPTGTFTEEGVHVRINSMGMRGAELAVTKAPETMRLLFLGDSSVYGFGVEEKQSFPYMTGKMLAQRLDKPVEVANAGVPGYSSTQCRIFFEDNMEKIKPDVVVMAALWSDMVHAKWTDAELLRQFSSTGYRFTGSTRLFMRNSSLFTLLEARIESTKPIPEDRLIFWQSVFQGADDNDPNRVSVSQHSRNLRAICERCRQKGIEIALLVLPYNTYLSHLAESKPQEDGVEPQDQVLGIDDPDLMKLKKNYRIISEEYSTVYLNMQELLLAFSFEEIGGLFLDTVHPNVPGHELIAKELTERLSKRLRGLP